MIVLQGDGDMRVEVDATSTGRPIQSQGWVNAGIEA